MAQMHLTPLSEVVDEVWGKTGTLIVATHGIVKKTQKTPQKEIAKAEEIRQQYFELKH